jgi:tagatose 1,6-diphosphate aldolase
MTSTPVTISPGKFWGLRRMADKNGFFCMLAVDQRPPIKNLIKERLGVETAPPAQTRHVKRLLMQELAPAASAVLADPTHALTEALSFLDPSNGLIVTLEDSIFHEEAGGRRSQPIANWTVDKIRRVGGDAVKVLTWYRPDQSEPTRQHQLNFTRRIGEACAEHDIPFLLEMLVYPLKDQEGHTTDYVEQIGKRAEDVLKSVETFAASSYGVDVFKLESPIPAADVPDPETGDAAAIGRCQELFNEMGRLAGRPWVMLSAGATQSAFKRVLHYAYRAGASGYLAGRAIWWDAFQAYPDMGAVHRSLVGEGLPYMEQLNAQTVQAATPWHKHPAFGGCWPKPTGYNATDFASRYASTRS